MKIGNVNLANPYILAPMAGVTDLPFRLLCKEQGAGLLCMEMISAKALQYKNKNTKALLAIHPDEYPVSLQLFGSDPKIMSEMAKMIEELPFQILDINMGCPVPKVVRNGEGSALMKNPELVHEIVSAVSKAIKKPVTVKIRKGSTMIISMLWRSQRLSKMQEVQRSQYTDGQENNTIPEKQTGISSVRSRRLYPFR